jgi:hypothetical protein
MPPRPYRIGRSRTGFGLFATREIRKRKRIAEYVGPRLALKEAEKAENSGNRYLFEVNSRWTIDGTTRRNIARYFNHSCNPNAEAVVERGRVFITTLRRIKPGEEITYSYGGDYLRNVIGKSNCKCGRCMRRRARQARDARRLKKARDARQRKKAQDRRLAQKRRVARAANNGVSRRSSRSAPGHATKSAQRRKLR